MNRDTLINLLIKRAIGNSTADPRADLRAKFGNVVPTADELAVTPRDTYGSVVPEKVELSGVHNKYQPQGVPKDFYSNLAAKYGKKPAGDLLPNTAALRQEAVKGVGPVNQQEYDRVLSGIKEGNAAARSARFKDNMSTAANNAVGRSSGIMGALDKTEQGLALAKTNALVVELLKYAATADADTAVIKEVTKVISPKVKALVKEKVKVKEAEKAKTRPVPTGDGRVYQKPESNFLEYAKNRLLHHVDTSKSFSGFYNPIKDLAVRGFNTTGDAFGKTRAAAVARGTFPYYAGKRLVDHYSASDDLESFLRPAVNDLDNAPTQVPDGLREIYRQIMGK